MHGLSYAPARCVRCRHDVWCVAGMAQDIRIVRGRGVNSEDAPGDAEDCSCSSVVCSNSQFGGSAEVSDDHIGPDTSLADSGDSRYDVSESCSGRSTCGDHVSCSDSASAGEDRITDEDLVSSYLDSTFRR